jgi:hypothetical protein
MRELNGQVRKPLLSISASLFATTIVFFSMAAVAYGQGITTGTITVTVVDPSGAAIPSAQVIATSNSQGTQRQTTSGTSDSQVTTTFDSRAVQNIPLKNGFDTITEVIPVSRARTAIISLRYLSSTQSSTSHESCRLSSAPDLEE